jgi:hypothetical protein
MAQETFTVVALPYSRSTARPFHVSLFISPDLVPDGQEGMLSDFAHWVKWTAGLQGASITLFNQLGTIPATALLNNLDAQAWAAIFPPDTPVRRKTAPDWDDRHWRTFRATEVQDTAKLFSFFSMATSPTNLPTPDPERDPISLIMRGIVGQTRRERYDESRFTLAYDRLISEPSVADRLPLDHIEGRIEAATGLPRALMELHRARRFYERPEAKVPYKRRPVDGAMLVRPPKPAPDFHERVSLLGDHPGVRR